MTAWTFVTPSVIASWWMWRTISGSTSTATTLPEAPPPPDLRH